MVRRCWWAPTAVASHRSDWQIRGLDRSLGLKCFNADNRNFGDTALHDLHPPGKKKEREKGGGGEKNSVSPASVSPRQIWYTGSKHSCVNSAWINHSLVFIALHFMLRPLFSLSVVRLRRSLTRGRCCKLDETPPDLSHPPWSENEDEQPDSGGGPVLQYL